MTPDGHQLPTLDRAAIRERLSFQNALKCIVRAVSMGPGRWLFGQTTMLSLSVV